MFQHSAARRRLGINLNHAPTCTLFQHSAARRRLLLPSPPAGNHRRFNTQPPEGGWTLKNASAWLPSWFQHSAARRRLFPFRVTALPARCFNTQPPEGGWFARIPSQFG